MFFPEELRITWGGEERLQQKRRRGGGGTTHRRPSKSNNNTEGKEGRRRRKARDLCFGQGQKGRDRRDPIYGGGEGRSAPALSLVLPSPAAGVTQSSDRNRRRRERTWEDIFRARASSESCVGLRGPPLLCRTRIWSGRERSRKNHLFCFTSRRYRNWKFAQRVKK